MNYIFQSHPSLRWLQCLALILILSPSTSVSGTNLTEQYRLCKTDAEIETLQQNYGLIRVDARPTHAALQPGWPETLVTLALSIYVLITIHRSTNAFGWKVFLFKLLIPLLLQINWAISFLVSFSIAERYGGWISVNLLGHVLTQSNLREMTSYKTTSRPPRILVFPMVIGSSILSILQFVGSILIVNERLRFGLGSFAYRILDAHGCMPFNGFHYLEQGARSHGFEIIQVTQLAWAIGFALMIVRVRALEDGRIGCLPSTRAQDYFLFPVSTIAISIPLLVYESVIATKGRPVVISGNCMVVELDPKFGFLDSEIDTYWKVLVGLGGL